MDIARSEAVEDDLDRLIERRSRKGEVYPDEQEELWKESVRRFNEKRRQMARAEWHFHHTAQAERPRRTLEALASHHEEQAARLMEDEPRGDAA